MISGNFQQIQRPKNFDVNGDLVYQIFNHKQLQQILLVLLFKQDKEFDLENIQQGNLRKILYLLLKYGKDLRQKQDLQLLNNLLQAIYYQYKELSSFLNPDFCTQLPNYINLEFYHTGQIIIEKNQYLKKQYYILEGLVDITEDNTAVSEDHFFGLNNMKTQTITKSTFQAQTIQKTTLISLHHDITQKLLKQQQIEQLQKQINVLKQFSIFSNQSDILLRRINTAVKNEQFFYKNNIIQDLNKEQKVFFILNGSVEIRKVYRKEYNKKFQNKIDLNAKFINQKEVVISNLTQGQFFGKLSEVQHKFTLKVVCNSQVLDCYSLQFFQFKQHYIHYNQNQYEIIQRQIYDYYQYANQIKEASPKKLEFKRNFQNYNKLSEKVYIAPEMEKIFKNQKINLRIRSDKFVNYSQCANEINMNNHMNQTKESIQGLVNNSVDKQNMMFLLKKFKIQKTEKKVVDDFDLLQKILEDDDKKSTKQTLRVSSFSDNKKTIDLKLKDISVDTVKASRIQSSRVGTPNQQSLFFYLDFNYFQYSARPQIKKRVQTAKNNNKLKNIYLNNYQSNKPTPFQDFITRKNTIIDVVI